MKGWSNSNTGEEFKTSVPEKRLLAAVLQRAVTDYVSGEGDVKTGAGVWLMEDECTDAPLTFKFVCEALDLDSTSLRKAIQLMADQALLLASQQLTAKANVSTGHIVENQAVAG